MKTSWSATIDASKLNRSGGDPAEKARPLEREEGMETVALNRVNESCNGRENMSGWPDERIRPIKVQRTLANFYHNSNGLADVLVEQKGTETRWIKKMRY